MFKNRKLHRLLAELSTTWLFDEDIERGRARRAARPAKRPELSLVRSNRGDTIAKIGTERRTPATLRAARSG
jgi:hypothetical protein